MFNLGEYAIDKLNKDRVQILAVSAVWGYVSYKVYRQTDGAVYMLTADDLSVDHPVSDCNVNYIRYIATLTKIKNEIVGGVLSKLSNDVIPLPHQRYVLERAISGNNIRYILADEVGLGKTIEAGLIIKELKMRGLIKASSVMSSHTILFYPIP